MKNSSWTPHTIAAAALLCFGTTINSLCFQHVSNSAPQYFFVIGIFSPLVGFLFYFSLIVVGQWSGTQPPSQLTQPRAVVALKYSVMIGSCFAVTNLLTNYGQSGRTAGVPDVSTVLILILLKLVVPVSLALESLFEQRRPTHWELSGVTILLVGIIFTGLINSDSDTNNNNDSSNDISSDNSKSAQYRLKIICLCLASVPLSMGFYIVKVTRRKFPQLTGTELWAILCIPEVVLSVMLSHFAWQSSTHLTDGLMCVLVGHSNNSTTTTDSSNDDNIDANNCQQAAFYYWLGLPFAFLFNLCIPFLIQSKGSTSVPLFRALALPLSTLIAMTDMVDRVIQTPFSWDAVFGVVVSTIGLLVFYGTDIQKLVKGHYRSVPNNMLV